MEAEKRAGTGKKEAAVENGGTWAKQASKQAGEAGERRKQERKKERKHVKSRDRER